MVKKARPGASDTSTARRGSAITSVVPARLVESPKDLNLVFDNRHTEVMASHSNLKDIAEKAKSLEAPQDESAIASNFAALIDQVEKSSLRRSTTILPEEFAMYTPEDLTRPSKRYRKREEARPYSRTTVEEATKIIHSMSFRRLQGKMQLFPLHESPLLRTRLTHTLEVADIANRIAIGLNEKIFKKRGTKIDTSIVTAAALAHDLGHPPFGHTGELALADFMDGHGSFEGNAQTLRILTRLENRFVQKGPQKTDDIYSDPLGLNLMYRTIASVIKYDKKLSVKSGFQKSTSEDGVVTKKLPKGFYEDDKNIVEEVRAHVIRPCAGAGLELRTIECQIMDIADDIAYSTYDLEDCMIADITHPLDLISTSQKTADIIALKTSESLAGFGYNYKLDSRDISLVYLGIFQKLIMFNDESDYNINSSIDKARYLAWTYVNSIGVGSSHLRRRALTETLINTAIESISISHLDAQQPALASICIDAQYLIQIEALKHYNYHNNILSDRLQIYASRASMILQTLCERLFADDDNRMMSTVDRLYYDRYIKGQREEDRLRRRFICDNIAAMTDDEAIKMYTRVATSNVMSVFGPL